MNRASSAALLLQVDLSAGNNGSSGSSYSSILASLPSKASLHTRTDYLGALRVHGLSVEGGEMPATAPGSNAPPAPRRVLNATAATLGTGLHTSESRAGDLELSRGLSDHGPEDEQQRRALSYPVKVKVERLVSFLEASCLVPHHGLSLMMQTLIGRAIKEQLEYFSADHVHHLMSTLDDLRPRLLLLKEVARAEISVVTGATGSTSSYLVSNSSQQQWWSQLMHALMVRVETLAEEGDTITAENTEVNGTTLVLGGEGDDETTFGETQADNTINAFLQEVSHELGISPSILAAAGKPRAEEDHADTTAAEVSIDDELDALSSSSSSPSSKAAIAKQIQDEALELFDLDLEEVRRRTADADAALLNDSSKSAAEDALFI